MTLVWTDNLSFGIEDLDEARREVIREAEMLRSASRGEAGPGTRTRLLAGLIGAMERLFALEEELMAALDFPGMEDHVREHHDLLVRLGRYRAALEAGWQTLDLPAAQFIVRNLDGHFEDTDRTLQVWAQKQGAGLVAVC